MDRISDLYRRFDQKNNMVCRPHWDSSLDHLTAQRHEAQFRNMKGGLIGFGLQDYALAASSGLLANSLGTHVNEPNSGLTSWEELPIPGIFKFPEEKQDIVEETDITNRTKRVARYLGADLVGIAKLDMRWVYSHHYIPKTGESKQVEIDSRYKNVIIMAIEMDYDMQKLAPSALLMAEVQRSYSRMAYLVGSLAQFIRQLGYSAIPSINDTALNVPIAIDAGLGQLSRLGLLITPQFGPRQRLCKVITDLPLAADEPVDFGVTEFCSVCKKCARECPAQAVFQGELTAEVSSISNNPGVMKWPLSAEKCREYWGKVGTVCGVCVRVCPFNKGGRRIHNLSRWLINHMPSINPVMVRLDDLLGYGKYHEPKRFWNNRV